MNRSYFLSGPSALVAAFALCSLPVLPAYAAQVDIHGPLGSVAFGTSVTVLSSGNIVVTDPDGSVSAVGAVYLYSPSGTLISTLTGSSTNDHVGSGGVVEVGSGNFLVASPGWNNVGAAGAGAATWVNGSTGLSGVVSASNSLVGTTAGDQVGFGYGGVTVLTNGNYVVPSPNWNDDVAGGHFGAATWGNGSIGITGPVSISNSLVGTTIGDAVGNTGVTALTNGNYVVASTAWNDGAAGSNVGAVTWGSGSNGITGSVSAGNSLVGTTALDNVGSTVALTNGNYVVCSPYWNNGVAYSNVGAATWGNGSSGITGPVSTGNSLIGTAAGDNVCSSGVTALTNGNYVVASSDWNYGAPGRHLGAATWGNGSSGIAGPVSASNSLVGTTFGDYVGNSVTALTNGNYVVVSSTWNNGVQGSKVGAATWGNGSNGIAGPVSASNSLVGTTDGDNVGNFGVTALTNGNYVVASFYWGNGVASQAGAATWGNGSSGVAGPVSASNSLVGTAGDMVGNWGVTALSNGNYVVVSYNWSNEVANGHFGAATWGSGTSGIVGAVSASNSLIGSTAGDAVGFGRYGASGVTALSSGNFMVPSSGWNSGVAGSLFGAATWGNGNGGITGSVSASNSLIGTTASDGVGYSSAALSDGNYVVESPYWSGGRGAFTLANGAFRLKATIQPWNSVLGTAAGGGASMTEAYDPVRHVLVVGRPADNIVSLFTMDQIFASDFEP